MSTERGFTYSLNELLDMLYKIESADQINLFFSDNGYINSIDTDSIFYRGVRQEVFSYGEIAVEISNIVFAQIINIFDCYKKLYGVPTL